MPFSFILAIVGSLLLALVRPAACQEELFCAGGSEEGINVPGPQTRGGTGPAATDTLRALLIFATCPDAQDGNSCGLANGNPYSGNWSNPTSLPSWADSLFEDTTTPGSFTPQIPGSLTHYFHKMSGGKHLLLGRKYPSVVTTSLPISLFGCNTFASLNMNNHILTQFVDLDPNFSFSDFDMDSDGYVDYVFIYYWSPLSSTTNCPECPSMAARLNWISVCGQTFTGHSQILPADLTVDAGPNSKIIDREFGASIFPLALTTSSNCGGSGNPNPTRVRNRWMALATMAHEYFHDIFDDVWPTLGGGSGPSRGHISSAGPYDLMEDQLVSPMLSAATRLKAGWLTQPIDLATRASEWDSTLVLRDAGLYSQQNVAILRTTDTNQYFVLEARSSATSPYEKDQPPDLTYDCCKLKGNQSGLLVSHVYENGQRGWYRALNGGVTTGRPPIFDPEIADGLFILSTAAPDPRVGTDSLRANENSRIFSQAKDLFRPGSGFSNTWAPYTNPNTNLYSSVSDSTQGVYGGWSVYNVEWAGPGTDSVRVSVRYDPVAPPASGGADTLRSNTKWEGIVQLTGDLVVRSNARLSVAKGTMVVGSLSDRHQGGSITGKPELIIKGKMEVIGYPGEEALFSSSRDNAFVHFRGAGESQDPASGNWGGIRVDSRAHGAVCSDSVLINYGLIRFATRGIAFQDTCNLILFASRFSNNSEGDIYLDRDVSIPIGRTWEILAPARIVATANACVQDIAGGESGLIDLFVRGRLLTNRLGGSSDYVFFESTQRDSVQADDWGGITIDWTSSGTNIAYADLAFAPNPLYAYTTPNLILRYSKIHHYREEGVFLEYVAGTQVIGNHFERGNLLNGQVGNAGLVAKYSAPLIQGNTFLAQRQYGIKVENSKTYCESSPAQPETLVVQANVLTGSGELDNTFSSSGMDFLWLCDNRNSQIRENRIEEWSSVGVKMTQCVDVQSECNEIVNDRTGLNFSRNTSAAGPKARFKNNEIRSSPSGLIRTDEALKLGLGDLLALTVGQNILDTDTGVKFIITSDADSADTLDARKNEWKIGGGSTQDTTAIRDLIAHDSAPGAQYRIKIAQPLTGLQIQCLEGTFRVPKESVAPDQENVGAQIQRPIESSLGPAFPSPFEDIVRWELELTGNGTVDVLLEVFDIAGRRVMTLPSHVIGPGRYSIIWDGRDANGSRVSGGIYFLRAKVGSSPPEVSKFVYIR